MLESYNADVVLRVEDLPWSFIDFLESMGVSKGMREHCLSLNAQNNTPWKKLPVWSPSLRARVIEAEAELVERFEY